MNDVFRAPPPTQVDTWRVYRRLIRYAKPHWGMFSIGVVGMTMFAATNAGWGWLVKEFLNETFVSRDPDVLWFVPVAIVTIFFVRGLGDYIGSYFPGWVGRQIIKAMRAELFAHYLRLPAAYYDRNSSAQMLSKLTYNIELVAEAATSATVVLIRDSLSFIALLVWLFILNWKLAALALVLAPPISWLIRRVNQLFRRYSARIQNSMGDVTRVTREALDAQRVIKVFNAQEHEMHLFDPVNEHNRRSNMRLIGTKAMSNPVVQLIAALGLSGVLYFAIRSVFAEELPVGDFLSFLATLMLLTAPLRQIVNVFGPLQQGITAGASVFEVLDEPVENQGGTRTIDRARGDVRYRDVRFVYSEEKGAVLRDINLEVKPSTTVAIVGKSGSGKSTLVGLLPRFYDAQQGAVLLDGVDVRDYRLADLRRQIALVSQDVVLFNDTIRNNIAFAMPDASPKAIESAADAAYVMEFARDLPQGLDSPVGDRGALLSGGQRQRIAIARALLKNAPILILDEAMSALDAHSERLIQQALDELVRDRTTLVIAHKFSTVEKADLIVVLDEGAIVEQGTHAELLVRGGLYAQLHRLQFSA